MAKLPVVSGADAIQALERLGFAVVRQRGSHSVLRKESNGCVVPNHRELKLGTLTGILIQAASLLMNSSQRYVIDLPYHDSCFGSSFCISSRTESLGFEPFTLTDIATLLETLVYFSSESVNHLVSPFGSS
jgi:predicted RNA binding protein YcfA (HicA-like mRNA interferase family)